MDEMIMKKTKQSKYVTQYIKDNLDEVKIRMPKGDKAGWKDYAEKRNESLNSFILRTINKAIMDDEIKAYPINRKRKGEKGMNITFRDSNGKLYSKDILDIALDMEVSKSKSGKYVVNLNRGYILDEEFDSSEEAEDQLRHLSNVRNHFENELRSQC